MLVALVILWYVGLDGVEKSLGVIFFFQKKGHKTKEIENDEHES